MAPVWAAEVWARPSEVPWVMAASGLGNHRCHLQTPCACLFGAVQLCRPKPQSPFWLLTGTPAKTVPKMRFGSLPSEHSRRAEMEVLLLFVALLQEPASSTLYGPRFLSGAVGGSITHQCFYSITPANKHDRKFWCKRKSDGICYTIISTTNFISEDHVGRVALEDVPQNGTFMVTMTQLKTSDTGTYRCGIGPTNSDLHVSLNLTVSADVGTQRPIELFLGKLRGSVTIPCPPGDSRGGTRRLWCRVGKSSCILIADTDGYVGMSYEGRIYITPQESSGAFKVLINDLRPEDVGLYKCGMGSPADWDSWQMVALQVTTVPAQPRRVKFLHGSVGGSLSLRCHHDPAGSYTSKYLCRWQKASCSLLVDTDGFVQESYKGRMWISNSMQDSGTYTVMMSRLQEEDAGWYWCGARSGHREHTTPMKLLIEKEIFTSPNPARHNSMNPTLPFRSSSNHVVTQSSTTWPTDTTGPTDTMDPTDTTGLRLTAMLAYITGTRTEGTSPHPSTSPPPSTFVTSHSDTYSQSSSGEFSLLSVVIPALVLLIFIITTVLVLTKIKLRKEMEEGSTLGQTEAVLVRTGLSPTEGQGMEDLSSPDSTNGCKAESGRHRMIRALLGRFGQTRLYESFSEKYSFHHE
ncbi:polymeric immunoglobulin receptor-like isoform X1 [Centrocercus urophasianus]|uniref:polymeric immunoglobulin receptor-like isoform X1 n=2 Tax=Centrocercus urophasianus TaxID=9002 RepID=UPI001C64F254|nr:polymeric immunoglobulin receptor-like isoform X1 [Centrocercus urophasianus]